MTKVINGSVVTEVISIVIGVLLALGVNEWNENRVHKSRANEAIQNVIQEINSNIEFITIVNTNNRATIESLNGQNANFEDEPDAQFVPGLQIQDTAWEMLHSTGVSEFIDYPTLYEISAIYSLQDVYKSLGYQLLQSVSNHRAMVSATTPNKSSGVDVSLFVGDMMLIEKIEGALLSSYEKALENLEEK